jgi:small ligand-binding sensory domain FIST
MLHVGVGRSLVTDSHRAVQEAVAEAMERAQINGRANLAVLFATPNHGPQAQRLLRTVHQVSGAIDVVGCSAAGVFTTEGEIERASGLAVLVLKSSDVASTRFFVPNLRHRAQAAGEEIGTYLRPALRTQNLVVLLPDTYNLNAPPFLAALRETLGDVTIVGGGASEDGSVGETFQLCGNAVSHNAVTGFLLAGRFRVTVGITQACRPVGPPLTVTRAEGGTLIQLDGRPAFHRFREIVPQPLLEDIRRAVARVFIGIPVDPRAEALQPGRYLVRNIVGFDPSDGRIAMAHAVGEGQRISLVLREPIAAREDLKRMVAEQAQLWQDRPPAFGFYFNCLARGEALYGMGDIDHAYVQQRFGNLPVIGFFTGAEIAPISGMPMVHQYTGVLVLVGEDGNSA